MLKNNLKSIGLGIGSALLVLSFNNCGQKLNTTGAPTGASTLASNSFVDINESASGGSVHTLLANDTTAQSANRSLLDNFNLVKMYVSNSASGPWEENGSVCKGQASYFKMTGVNPNLSFKGCASPSSSQGCLDATKHRVFNANEWVSGNIVTTISAAESAGYPLGGYSFYVSGENGNTNIIQKIGTAILKSCAASAPPATKSCQWAILNPRAVIGGGSNVYPYACTTSTNAQKAACYYDMGGGRHEDFNCECRCN